MQKLQTPDMNKVKESVKKLLEALNLPLDDVHLKDTPDRIARMLVNETLVGLYSDPPKITSFEDPNTSLVIVDNISVKSVCSHHFVPFYGKAVISYLPRNNRIIGLSKFSRIVDYFARRPQVQEKLACQIADFIFDIAKPWFVIVGLKCRHLCLTCRGPNDSAVMETVVHKSEDNMSLTPYLDIIYSRLRDMSVEF